MANKAISELPQALNVNNQDLFVLEQSGIAKKLTAETFITEQGIIDALAEALDGHGGISSVTLSSVSGRIRTYLITFTDGTSTTFQVLDGTSIDRITKTSTAGLVDTYTVFMTDGTTTFFTVTNGADGTVSEAMLNDALKDKAPAITETTESSAIATFSDGADDMVMHNVIVEINPVQDLSNGDPSPDNICPISGYTQATVTRAGANLLDDNGYSMTGEAGVNKSYNIGLFVYLIAGQTYTFAARQAKSAGTQTRNLLFVYKQGTTSPLVYESNNSATAHVHYVSYTPTVSGYYSPGWWAHTLGTAVTLDQFCVGVGSSVPTYAIYQSTTLTVDWTTEAGTVYGGTIDVATGLLTVDRGMVTLDGNTLWTAGTTSSIRYYNASMSALNTNAWELNVSTNMFKKQSGGVPYCQINGAKEVRLVFALDDTNYDTAAKVQALLTNTPLQVVYPLTTPQTYQLTPQQLMTLLGTNNVWADTGNVSVTYPADTKMFIEKLTMPTEDDLVANQAITSGKYFMIGNSLYLALANIASGAQITIGTNAQRVSLADALNTINA